MTATQLSIVGDRWIAGPNHALHLTWPTLRFFREMRFLAAAPASERSRSAKEGFGACDPIALIARR